MLLRDRRVDLDDAERVETARDRARAVQGPQRVRDLVHGETRDLAYDETCDEVALGPDEADDLGRETELGGNSRRGMLGAAVDPEELGVLAPDPEDEGLAADRDLEVPVRDPPAERLDRLDAARPDAREDRIDHARTRSPSGSKSGSAATSPPIHSPKISTSTRAPTSCAAGRYAYAIERSTV